MPEIPNVLFINWVDTKAQIDYDKFGNGRVPVNQAQPSNPLDVTEYRRVTVMIGNCNAKSASMHMGKISGPTLCESYEIPLDFNAHTFEVIGPQMTLLLKDGPPNMSEKVQVWLYLRS
jgi:hypothetical protein